MKILILTFAHKFLLPLLIFCSAWKTISAQTFIHVKPVQLAETIAERCLNFGDYSNTGAIVSEIDSVIWSGKTIGYVIYFKTGGIVVIPKIREINPLFALSSGAFNAAKDEKQIEIFLKEELVRRYLAIVHQRISLISIQRNEKMWQQILLAEGSL